MSWFQAIEWWRLLFVLLYVCIIWWNTGQNGGFLLSTCTVNPLIFTLSFSVFTPNIWIFHIEQVEFTVTMRMMWNMNWKICETEFEWVYSILFVWQIVYISCTILYIGNGCTSLLHVEEQNNYTYYIHMYMSDTTLTVHIKLAHFFLWC